LGLAADVAFRDTTGGVLAIGKADGSVGNVLMIHPTIVYASRRTRSIECPFYSRSPGMVVAVGTDSPFQHLYIHTLQIDLVD
jgi:hypothetical protein